ncbi:MAG: hypothetical protein M5R36_11635 [Deltaproteobacteria bacterium]|nr:hypothetical protein [Deltaproteobacteria bacterium]
MDEPPKAPWTLTDPLEIAISEGSDRPRFFVLTEEESKQKLEEYKEKLAQCEQDLVKDPKDGCQGRAAALYELLLGDRYVEQKRYDEAMASYVASLNRLGQENENLEKEYEKRLDETKGLERDPTFYTMTREHYFARMNFQTYKDFAEIARAQKRIIELLAKTGRENETEDKWTFVREAIQTSAEYKRKFDKNFEALRAIKDDIPEIYSRYWTDIEQMAESEKINQI